MDIDSAGDPTRNAGNWNIGEEQQGQNEEYWNESISWIGGKKGGGQGDWNKGAGKGNWNKAGPYQKAGGKGKGDGKGKGSANKGTGK